MTESQVSREIVAFLRSVGCTVHVLSRNDPGGRRTPKSLPDLLVMDAGRYVWTWAELKAPKGGLRDGQESFRKACIALDIPWECWRSLDDAKAWAKVRLGVDA